MTPVGLVAINQRVRLLWGGVINSPAFCCSLKMECEKLAQEKTEMQRHYVMVSALVLDQGEFGQP